MIQELTFESLTWDGVQRLAEDPFHHFYWSLDWSTAFYATQARLGFISVTTEQDGVIYLLPELQTAYAVLFWPNLHIGKTLGRLLYSEHFKNSQVRLTITSDPNPVLNGLEAYWGKDSWIRTPYRKILENLARSPQSGVRVLAVELRCGPKAEIAAGEVGYTIGRAYTSLSGFHRRDVKKWNNFGKVQMVLLAEALKGAGFSFWNLGHPYMEYKLVLGAKVVSRQEFLSLWRTAVEEESPGYPVKANLTL